MKWFRIFASRQQAEQTVPSGQMRQILAGGQEICLVNHNGDFKAIQDTCPHLGDSLSGGHLTPYGEVTCPWHSYRYDLKTGRECSQRTSEAKVFEVKWEDGELLVGV